MNTMIKNCIAICFVIYYTNIYKEINM